MKMIPRLEVRLLCPELGLKLGEFFNRLTEAGIEKYFHPHSFTMKEAVQRSQYLGKDLYYALWNGSDVLAYGMLRGWDEGYDVPSLGIVVDPVVQGQGYGRLLMQFMHEAARARGARRVRLKVHSDNNRALALYRSLGYVFHDRVDDQIVGFVELGINSDGPEARG